MGESTVGGARSPVSDPFDAVPELAPLRTAAWDGDWGATQAFFKEITSTEEVSFAAALLAGVERTEWFLEKAVKDRPTDPLPPTRLAEGYTPPAWRAPGPVPGEWGRGGGAATSTPPDGAPGLTSPSGTRGAWAPS